MSIKYKLSEPIEIVNFVEESTKGSLNMLIKLEK